MYPKSPNMFSILHYTYCASDKLFLALIIVFQEDAAAILDIKEDIRDECSKLGAVTNVVLFDKEADGVASVRFADEMAARECVKVSPVML